jgi:hypothetical protein
MSDDLIAFLTGRLDEDERVADGLAGATRFIGGSPDFYGQGGPAADAYWERFTPARVLREVEAKRKHLASYEHVAAACRNLRSVVDEDHPLAACRDVARFAVMTDAAVYRDHPDYLQEWAP